jgi:hypothetical protein
MYYFIFHFTLLFILQKYVFSILLQILSPKRNTEQKNFIKYPTKVIDWSKDEIKNYDNNGKAFEFITKLNIEPSEDDFENKNRVDFKCRLLQEGAY